MTKTERNTFYAKSHCHARRWRIKFDKYLQSGIIVSQSDEVFGLYESAVEFANGLQTKDGCNSYFNDDSSFAVNIRMYEEIGKIVREIPKERWSNLADQLTTISLRWQVRFTKCHSGHSSTSECESFETYEDACRFANNLSKKDFRNTYYVMSGVAAADIHIVETGKYERTIPWESWSELSKSIDEINKELDAEKPPSPWFKVWYKLHADGSVRDVSIDCKTLEEAKREANRIVKENRCYALPLVYCGCVKTDVRIQTCCPECHDTMFLPQESWLEPTQKFVVPTEYKKEGMTFLVEHSRVPKPTNFHDEASPMFVTDKFTTLDQARNFAMHLLNGDGPAYVIETGKTHWFFNINIYAVENDRRTLVPQDQWCDDVDAKEKNFSGILAYCSEVADIKGERDILRDELKKANAEIDSLKSAIRNELMNMSGLIKCEMDLMNKVLGDDNNGNNA